MAKSDDSIWLYNANFPLAIASAVLYAIPMCIQFYQTIIQYKAYYFVVVLIGACLEVGGYIARAVSIKQSSEIPPYAISSSFIVLAPLFIGAGCYMIISRLCLRVLTPNITHIYRIRTTLLTRIFVICDIVTFLIQVSGSGIASSGNWEGEVVDIGTNVLIAGLSLQIATFTFFVAIVARFHRITISGRVRDDAGDGWKPVLNAVYISSVLIIVRSIYRLVEFALGIWGYPFTHEWLFYVFEALPMLPAISIFCYWHPAKYFGGRRVKGGDPIEM